MNSPYSRDALNSRLAQRWPLHYKILFAYPEYAGEGVTLDVSAGGLCVITNQAIVPGAELYARLVLPDTTYLDIQTATVKWCDDGKLGFEISAMERPDALRLLDLLSHVGESAITYARQYHEGPITIGSCRDLGRYIAEALEASQDSNRYAPG